MDAGKRIRSLAPDEPLPQSEPRRFKNSYGYIRLRWKVGTGQYVEAYEHRVVAGADPDDHVHHINGIKDDNRPENLEVLSPAEHRAEHSIIDPARCVELYEQGWSLPKIARHLGHDNASILRAIRRGGGKTRSLSESLKLDLPLDKIKQLHAEGLRPKAIGEVLGVSATPIRVRLREMGIPAHRPGRPAP